MLNIQETDYGTPRAFRLKKEAKANLEALAEHYETTETKIINALLIQQGGNLLKVARERKA